MVGCSDFSADLKDFNERLENMAANTAKEIQNLSDAVKALEAKIAEQFATKEEVAAVEATVTALKADLKKAQEDLQAALDTKADKATVEAAIAQANEALAAIQTALAELTAKDEALAAADAALQAAIEALQKEVADAQAALQATIESIQNTIGSIEDALQFAINEIAALNDRLTSLQSDLLAYKAEVEAQFASVAQALVALEQTLTAKIDALASDAADKDEATVAQLDELKDALATVNAALLDVNAALADKADQADVDALEATLQAALKALENKVNSWKDNDTIYDDAELRAAIAAATAEYKAITADLQAQIDALAELVNGMQDSIDAVKNELRAAILVPDMLYNGTKAVKFTRLEGKNVLKTFATVSYRFNPSNFDASKATYEIVAEQVEVMTKGVFTEDPAIEIVGKPVQEDDKVTFELERAEGVGNMFALKVTLEDGTTIYSDYAAIVDEATYAVATATASFQVERLAFSFPSLNSISAIIEFVQSIGTTIEDFATTIEAINAAVKALQDNDVTGALENLIKIPGLRKETKTIYGTGTYRVQVETLDAEEIIEALQNAQTIDEIRKILTDLFAQAQGLGEAGSSIINGINDAIGGSGLNELLGQYDNLKDFQLPELVLTYEKAVATLDGYQAELNKAKAEFQTLKDEMDAIIAGLDAATQEEIAVLQAELDALNAQYADLQAQYDAAGVLDKIKIGAEMAVVLGQIETKELAITTKAGTEYFLVKAELDLKDAGVKTAELLLEGARKAVDVADKAVKEGEEALAKLETEIINKVKSYIMENTELGKYITELENALGEQAWEAKKTVAAGTAQLFAIDALIADLIHNYNAANQQVVDEFANSLFGRVAYLIQTQEAADAFELIGLTDLYTVLKQLPDVLTLIIKYYPAGVDLTNFDNFNEFGSIFSDYLTNLIPETKVEWELDYYMAQ